MGKGYCGSKPRNSSHLRLQFAEVALQRDEVRSGCAKATRLAIIFTTSLDNISESHLDGFFVGWSNPPTTAKHLALLRNSSHIVLAIDTETTKIVGFITALSDKTLAAYIPLLEVLPAFQKRGIGRELLVRMLDLLKEHYMIDLLCDPELQSFYEGVGLDKATGMMKRNYHHQSGM